MQVIKASNISVARKLLLVIAYLLVTIIVVMMFIAYPRINGYEDAMFGDMVYGKAHKPFAYRLLVPSVVRIISEATPKSLTDKIDSFGVRQFTPSRLVSIARIEKEYVFEFFISLGLIGLCFLGFALSLRAIIRHQYNFPDWINDLAPLGALLLAPLFFRYHNYLYDPAVLLFITLGTYLICRQQRWLYYIILILATLNKETSILLIGLFTVREYNDMKHPKLIGHIISQILIYVIIKGGLFWMYQNSPGMSAEFTLISRNLTAFIRPLSLLYVLAVFVIYFALVRYRWSEKPIFLRNGMIVLIIPLFVSVMLFGVIDEIRVFYEVFPLVYLLALPSVLEITGIYHKPESG